MRDDTHMASMKIVGFSRLPTPLVHLRPNFFHLFDLGRPISSENVNKLCNNNHIMNVNEQFKSKNKTKSHHIQIDHLANKKAMVSLKDGVTV